MTDTASPSFLSSLISGIAGALKGAAIGAIFGAAIGGAIGGGANLFLTGHAGLGTSLGAILAGVIFGLIGSFAGSVTGVVQQREAVAQAALASFVKPVTVAQSRDRALSEQIEFDNHPADKASPNQWESREQEMEGKVTAPGNMERH